MGSARSTFRPNGDHAKTNLGHRQARLATLTTRAEPAQELDPGPAGQDQCTPASALDHVWSGSGQNQKRLAGGLAFQQICLASRRKEKHTRHVLHCMASDFLGFGKTSISQISPNTTPAQNVGSRFFWEANMISVRRQHEVSVATVLVQTPVARLYPVRRLH